MSEQQNAELVKSVYDAFGRGDLAFILDRLAEDVDWALEGPAIIPYAGKRKGVAQVKQFFEALASTQTDNKLTVGPLVAQGDQVCMHGRFAATVISTGKSFDSAVAHFFTVRDGKISAFLDFVDTAAMAGAYSESAAAAR
jgi:uncharacterized protein